MLGRLRDRIKPKVKDGFMDPRLVEKILNSDLWEFFDNSINVLTGKKADTYYGIKIPDEPIKRFFMEVNSANSDIISRQSFANSEFSESEINTIFETYKFIRGAPARWFIKCLIWDFMCFREQARLAFLRRDKKSALRSGEILAAKIRMYHYIDWGKAIREFWIDESMKNYHGYLIVRNIDLESKQE